MPLSSDRPSSTRRPDAPADRAPDDPALPVGVPGGRLRRAIDAVADALSDATPSMEAVRDAAVRYGSAARALALAPDEMVTALHALLRRYAARHPAAVRAELEASVAWWAVHGYHRAD